MCLRSRMEHDMEQNINSCFCDCNHVRVQNQMPPCYWISSPNFSRGCLKTTLMLMLGMLWRVTRLRGWCPRLTRICLCQSSSGTECSCSRCTWSGLSILISSARQSLWLVLSDVSATMHYVLYVCVCCLHIIILSKGLSVNHVESYLLSFSYLPVTVAALKPLGALAILGEPPASGASADVTCKI